MEKCSETCCNSKQIICVTGPMAAGKNAACKLLENSGWVSVDADVLVHKAIENAKDKILAAFMPLASELKIPLLDDEGKILRKNLGSIIFTSPELIQKQESIVFPEVNALIQKFLEENKDKNRIINATVLYKVPSVKLCDFILYVDAPVLVRFLRARKRDGLSSSQIKDRFRSQKNLFSKYKNSNADIRRVWNTGSLKKLEKAVNKALLKH